MSIKILQHCVVLASTFKESVEVSLSSAIVKISVTNKAIVKTSISMLTFCYDKNKTFWPKNANMFFGFCNLHYLGKKFNTLS